MPIDKAQGRRRLLAHIASLDEDVRRFRERVLRLEGQHGRLRAAHDALADECAASRNMLTWLRLALFGRRSARRIARKALRERITGDRVPHN